MRVYKLVSLPDGTFAVGFGKKYYLDSVRESRELVEMDIIARQAADLQDALDKVSSKFDEMSDETKAEWAGHKDLTFGDLLC